MRNADSSILTHLNLDGNRIGSAGAESLAGVLGPCVALTHLDLGDNPIEAGGSESLTGVLAQRKTMVTST